MSKIGRNDTCPCGSGKKFKHCCYGKPFSWKMVDHETVQQVLPITGELEDILEKQRQEFIRHFAREPGEGDPVFLLKYLDSDEDTVRAMTEVMKRVGTDPAEIYAYRKTGRLITKENASRATGAALAEWNKAINEFDEQGQDPIEQTEAHHFDLLIESLVDELESLIYLLGLANDKFLNTDALPTSGDSSRILTPEQYQALCIVRTHRTLRSIRMLLRKHMSDDVIKLARSIYENYLHISYIDRNPDRVVDLVDAVVGIKQGTHSFQTTRSGKINKRTIVEIATGKEYSGHVPAYAMAHAGRAPSDVAFFDFFYKRTSEYLHPNVFTLDGYLSERGLDPVKPHMYEEGVVFSLLVATMVADRIPSISGCPSQVVRDVEAVVGRAKAKITGVLNMLNVWQQELDAEVEEVALLKRRCSELLAEG